MDFVISRTRRAKRVRGVRPGVEEGDGDARKFMRRVQDNSPRNRVKQPRHPYRNRDDLM